MPDDIDPPDPVLTPRTRTVGSLTSVGGAILIGLFAVAVADRCHARGAGWAVILEAFVVAIVALLVIGYLGSILTGGNEGARGFKDVADDVVKLETAAADAAKGSLTTEPPK